MNQTPLTITIQDLESLLTKNSCNCHFINPNKTRVILWKEDKNNSTTYYLRIGIQKFISYPLTDKNGAIYWRFNGYEKVISDLDNSDPITKFHQRQIKTEQINHDRDQSLTVPHNLNQLAISLKTLAPTDSETTQLITYTLLATAAVGIFIYHYIKSQEDN